MRLVAPVALAAALAAGVLTAAGPAGAAGTGSASGAPHTHRVVVRPVDAQGHPVSGWKVKRQHDGAVQCDGPSSSAVDDGITACFPTAEYLPACWPSQHHTVLCLRNARKHTLVRVRYTGSLGTPTAPEQASPLDLDLGDGQRCSIRFGGAWGVLPSHPNWLGFYSCTHGSIYGPAAGDGINRDAAQWVVHEWTSGTKDTVVRHRVTTAYVVGTAH